MSLKIGSKIAIKVYQSEYDLILYMREKMRYGKCMLVVHDGQPVRIENIQPSKIFGIKVNIEQTKEQLEKPGE